MPVITLECLDCGWKEEFDRRPATKRCPRCRRNIYAAKAARDRKEADGHALGRAIDRLR